MGTSPSLIRETESKLTVQQANAELQYSDIDVKCISVFNISGDCEPPRSITLIVHPSPNIETSLLAELDVYFPPVLSQIVFSFVPECIERDNGLVFLDGILFNINNYLVKQFSSIEILPEQQEANVEIIGVLHLFLEPSSVV